MRPSTIILSISLLLSLLLCMLFLYLWVDRAITLAYVNASLDSEIRARGIITSFIENELHGESKNDVYNKLKAEVDRHPQNNLILKVNNNKDVIYFDIFQFKFENEKLESIYP